MIAYPVRSPRDALITVENGNRMKTVDLGCGPRNKLPGSLGVDVRPAPHVDIRHDLDDLPLPLGDDEFDHVEMSHIIEHLERPLEVMAEVHRIAKPGGTVRVITPHYSSQLAYGDFEHRHRFGYITFLTLQNTGMFRIASCALWFTDLTRLSGLAWLANRMPRRWEKYHCWLVPALFVDVTLEVLRPAGTSHEDLVERYMY